MSEKPKKPIPTIIMIGYVANIVALVIAFAIINEHVPQGVVDLLRAEGFALIVLGFGLLRRMRK